jgi:hypothetical protein
MKNTILFVIKEGIPKKDAEGNHFTTKKYLVFVEKHLNSTSKTNVSALIMKMLTPKYNGIK